MRISGKSIIISDKTREYLLGILEAMRIRAYSLRAKTGMKNPVLTQLQVDEFLRRSAKAEEVSVSK